jgi:3-phenylpropionate/cinnamic acid dioxygenase small subunit
VAADRAGIVALVHEYAERLDAGDLDGVAALFEHATWRSDTTGQSLHGIDEVRRVYDRVVLYDGSPRTRHLITNLVVSLRPDATTAGARCYFTVLQGVVPGEPIQVILTGRYVDRFEQTGGRWRFADRLFVTDQVGDLSRHFR